MRKAFVGSYSGWTKAGQLGWVGGSHPGKGITAFSFDTATGKLSDPQVLDIGAHAEQSPTWLEASRDGQWLVAVHEVSHHTGFGAGQGWLSSYKIERDADGNATGALTLGATAPSGGKGNTAVTFDNSGKYVFATRYWEGGISILPFDPATGTFEPATDGGASLTCHSHLGRGQHELRQSSAHPHGIHQDPLSDFVFALDLGTDHVHQYKLDTAAGTLTPHSNVKISDGSGPRGIVFHPTLRVAYVNTELSGSVATCAIDSESGLTVLNIKPCYPEGFVGQDHPQNHGKAGLWAAEAVLTADAKWYYVICRVHQSITVFSVNAETGALTERKELRAALKDHSNARNLDVCETNTSTYLLVASQDADCVEVFKSDRDTGALAKVDEAECHCAADVAVV